MSHRMNRSGNLLVTGLVCLSGLVGLTVPRAAQAQTSAQRAVGGLLSIGGYFPTAGSGRAALGDSKFYGLTALYVRPAHIGNLVVTGGVEILSASDHFFPFSGGGGLTMIGPSVYVSLPRETHRIRPFATFSLDYAELKSERQNFDTSQFAVGASLGVDVRLSRFVSLLAGYRVNSEIHDVDTNGFFVSLKVF